jgi:hypothetical protein
MVLLSSLRFPNILPKLTQRILPNFLEKISLEKVWKKMIISDPFLGNQNFLGDWKDERFWLAIY